MQRKSPVFVGYMVEQKENQHRLTQKGRANVYEKVRYYQSVPERTGVTSRFFGCLYGFTAEYYHQNNWSRVSLKH